jgi:hypothetical protein
MKIVEGFVLRRVGDEFIVSGEGLGQVNLNRMFALNSTAAYLWQQVETVDFDVKRLADLLVEHYHIDVDVALSDAGKICDEWLKAGIVK